MLGAYQTFLTVVEHETVSAAAEVLHTTQPTVTRQIQQLERTLGTTLFDRVGKRLILTRAGAKVYDTARELLQTQTRLLDALSELTDPEQGTVRLGSGLTPCIYLLPNVIANYAAEHPAVRFHIVTGSSKEVTERLVRREIDLAFVTTPPADRDQFTAMPLWRDELCVVVAPSHPQAGVRCSVGDMAEMPLILMRSDSGLRQIVDQKLGARQEGLRAVVETDSLEAISRFVQAGLGMAVLPKSAVADDVAQGRLAIVTLTDATLGARTITALTRRSSGLPAVTAAFVQFLMTLT
ncbi:LysR family transcriptional regulator [Alicyclobacillus acidoterrestris]|uniref:LysR family transcriptional regulator n=1 Tax=Alicyclobacillus suci TaxID=2816080 RepID=UPI0011903DF8|nr:LysR family transcriptional regulator [Alicyclobacillus suci]GEO24428.1 LysR family transcriptional regulator [Alicyclobacillus acidoterrestris]